MKSIVKETCKIIYCSNKSMKIHPSKVCFECYQKNGGIVND